MKVKLFEEVIDAEAQDVIDNASSSEQQFYKTLERSLKMDIVGDPNELAPILDKALKTALRNKRQGKKGFTNVLVVGEAGSGKTSMIQSWANARGVNLYTVKANELDPTDMGGILAPEYDENDKRTGKSTRLANHEFDALQRRASILFLDEFNRAPQDTMGSIMQFVLDHTLRDATQPDGLMHFDNFLFTIAAINPSTGGSDTYDSTSDLDPAMRSRFAVTELSGLDVEAYLAYTKNKYAKSIKKLEDTLEKLQQDPDTDELDIEDAAEDLHSENGRLAIAEKVLSEPSFHFSDPDEIADAHMNGRGITNRRSFSRALDTCDGTKDDFIEQFSLLCDTAHLDTVEQALSDYTEVEDKATEVLKKYKDGIKIEDDDSDNPTLEDDDDTSSPIDSSNSDWADIDELFN